MFRRQPLRHVQVPGTFVATLNKPMAVCVSTLSKLRAQLGGVELQVRGGGGDEKPTPYFELLAKSDMNAAFLNDAYSVVSILYCVQF